MGLLKNTSVICQLKGRRCGFTRRMIDKKQTEGFPGWCEGLGRAKAGDQELRRQLLEAGTEADEHLNRMRDDQGTYAENLEQASKQYTDAELRALRAHKPISVEMFIKVFDNILNMAAPLFAANPNQTQLPPAMAGTGASEGYAANAPARRAIEPETHARPPPDALSARS
jgi:hypothetical protein